MKLAGTVSPAFEEETIHKIRTTIKKMRAIGEWAGVPIRKFFKTDYSILGNIRDAQLVLSKIKNGGYIAPAAFTDWLENGLHHHKAQWQKQYQHKKIKRNLNKLKEIMDDARQHNNKHSLKFERHKDKTLGLFAHERPISDEQIHSGRKTIKEIDFLNKWEKNNSDDQMKKLSDETGEYMDMINAIRLFEQYITEETDESKKKEAQLILADWIANKEQEKINLLRRIDSLPA
jgi:hypothetical protein